MFFLGFRSPSGALFERCKDRILFFFVGTLGRGALPRAVPGPSEFDATRREERQSFCAVLN